MNLLKKTEYQFLAFILLVGIVLRFYNYPNVQFTFDEVSALNRTHFKTFSELIDKGVKIDGHPAGVQVFLNYWVKIGGYNEPWVKLPFVLMGLASILLIFQLGKLWFNSNVGLLSAAFLATTQYSVMYSLIARPYISGLFLSLVMTIAWTKLLWHSEKKFWLNWVLYVLFSALMAYNHYFSLLFAIIVGFSGLLFIKKKYLLRYALAGISIFILFLPHWKVFLYQLDVGGVETWLGKPHDDFLLDYLSYLTHWTWIVPVALLVIFGISFWKKEEKKAHFKRILLAFSWFLLPFLIGFFYSKYVNAVLQFSVLIFSFPFLVIGFFALFPKSTKKINTIVVFSLMLVLTTTLIFHRLHYKIFYHMVFDEMAHSAQIANQKYGKENVSAAFYMNRSIQRFFVNKYELDSTKIAYFRYFESLKQVREHINSQSTDYFLYGKYADGRIEITSFIQEKYPYLIQKDDYFAGSVYLFSKIPSKDTINPTIFYSVNKFSGKEQKYWNSGDKNHTQKEFHGLKNAFVYQDGEEWGSPGFKVPIWEIISNRYNEIDIRAEIVSEKKPELLELVSTFEAKDTLFDWRSSKAIDYFEKPNKKFVIHHSIKLADIPFQRFKNPILSVSFWNRDKQKLGIDNFSIRVREGNKFIYSLFDDF